MRGQDQQVYRALRAIRDNISRKLTLVAVHDDETSCLEVLQPRLLLGVGGQPLVCIAVGRPAAVPGQESPVARRMC